MLLVKLGRQLKTQLLMPLQISHMTLLYGIYLAEKELGLLTNGILLIDHFIDGLNHLLHLICDILTHSILHLLYLLIVVVGPMGELVQRFQLRLQRAKSKVVSRFEPFYALLLCACFHLYALKSSSHV